MNEMVIGWNGTRDHANPPRKVVSLHCPACAHTCSGHEGKTCPNDGAILVPDNT
ncbi:MAG: hypothetical protein ABIO22_02945 [Candidatus Saccharimonadales bacterium]